MMHEKIKNILGLAIVIGVLAFAYGAVLYVRTYSKSIQPSAFRSFAVSGEGKATAIPDIAQFTMSVITQGGINVGKLISENTEKVNGAIGFVKSQGVDGKDVKTAGYNLEPRYQYSTCQAPFPQESQSYLPPRICPPPQIVGYTITQTVLVKVRDFTKIGDLLSGIVEEGANSVSQLQFTIDDRTKVQQQAREEAIAKAKEKAELVAKAGGFRVGRLLSIDEGGYQPYQYAEGIGGGGFEAATSKAVPAPTIEPGSQEVKVNVTLRYEIE